MSKPRAIAVKYVSRATDTGGRDGDARTEDGRFAVKLSTPKELGGPGGDGTNPEQLFASGYSACFIGALKVAGGQLKIRVPQDVSVTATVGIGPRSAGGFGITADLEISLPGVERADADRKSVGSGKSVSVRVDLGGRRFIKHKNTTRNKHQTHRNSQ